MLMRATATHPAQAAEHRAGLKRCRNRAAGSFTIALFDLNSTALARHLAVDMRVGLLS